MAKLTVGLKNIASIFSANLFGFWALMIKDFSKSS